jgi:hypothetical protein
MMAIQAETCNENVEQCCRKEGASAETFDLKQQLHKFNVISRSMPNIDSLCGLVVRVPGYRSRGSGSIPGDTTLSDK